jgi:hypothetical protein
VGAAAERLEPFRGARLKLRTRFIMDATRSFVVSRGDLTDTCKGQSQKIGGILMLAGAPFLFEVVR